MYYDRCLPPELFSLLKTEAPLRPLVDLTEEKWQDRNLRPDLQFRNDTISLYLGLTKVLQIRMDKKGNLHPKSAAAYGLHDHGVRAVYRPDESLELISNVRRFLDRVQVRDRYLSDEGRCQNWLSYRYGSRRRPGSAEPLAIDREVVIGYKNEAERDRLWGEPIREPALEIMKSISEGDPKLYGTNLHRRPLGNELDLLMWEPPGTFLVTEVKGGRNAHGIYMAPVQVAAYAMAWKHFAQTESLSPIGDLIAQKRELGLATMDDAEWDQFTASLATPQFVPAMVVQEPNRASTCWKLLGKVLEHVSTTWPPSWGPSVMGALRIYTVSGPEGSLEDHTTDCLGW